MRLNLFRVISVVTILALGTMLLLQLGGTRSFNGIPAARTPPAAGDGSGGDGAQQIPRRIFGSDPGSGPGKRMEVDCSVSNDYWVHPKKLANPQMEETEIRHILSHIHPDGEFLEWGSGSSTLLFPTFVRRYYSIEHNSEWCARINSTLIEKESTVSYHCPIVTTEERLWEDQGEGTYAQFKKYVDYVDQLGVPKFDLVLIDGRARLPCAIKVLPYLKPSSVVFVHDMFLRDYSFLWELYEPLDIVFSRRGLVALRPKYIHTFPINPECAMSKHCTIDTSGIKPVKPDNGNPSGKEVKMRNWLISAYLQGSERQSMDSVVESESESGTD